MSVIAKARQQTRTLYSALIAKALATNTASLTD
jgi:hypothetical protein